MRERRIAALLSAIFIAGCVGPPLEVQPDELPTGVQGTFYESEVFADTGDARFSVVSGELPAGLTLSSGSGILSGTPQAFGTFEFTIEAESNVPQRRGERGYSLLIIEELLLSPNLDTGRVGIPYIATPGVTGGVPPYTIAVIGLPAGLTFDPSTGQIAGTPVNSSDGLIVELTVTDSGTPQQSTSAQSTLVIKPPPVQIDTAVLPNGQVGNAYSATVAASQGATPYRFSVSTGVLPAGLRLNPQSGAITGTPTAAGSSTFTILVVDADSPPTSASQLYTVEVLP